MAAPRWAALSDWRGWPGSGGPGRPERMGGRPTGFPLTAPRQPVRGRCRDCLPPAGRPRLPFSRRGPDRTTRSLSGGLSQLTLVVNSGECYRGGFRNNL